MKLLLEEIQSIPGVIGSFIFHSRQQLLISDLPAVFKERKLVKIGKMLIKMFNTSRSNFPDTSEISLFYEESYVIIREIKPATFVIVLCTPSVNLNLLTMTMNLIMEDIDQYIKDMNPDSSSETPSPQLNNNTPAKAPLKQHTDVRALMKEGPLADILSKMQKALAKIVGPMAKIIFVDALRDWTHSEKPSKESLKELVLILNKELQDPEKIARYGKLIREYIASGEKKDILWRGGQRQIEN